MVTSFSRTPFSSLIGVALPLNHLAKNDTLPHGHSAVADDLRDRPVLLRLYSLDSRIEVVAAPV